MKRPIRICYLIDGLTRAGTETQLLALIRSLDRRRFKPSLVLLNGEDDLSRELAPADCPVLRLGLHSLRSVRSLAATTSLIRFWRRERIDIATVAGRHVLAKPAVAAIIVGARNPSHIVSNARLAQVGLSDADIRDIDEVTVRRTGPAGDTYTLERDRTGRHGSIMLYNLNAKAS